MRSFHLFYALFLWILLCQFTYQTNAHRLRASNIIYRTLGDKIEIFYDLPHNSDTLNVQIFFCKKSNPKMRYQLQNAKGSIGVGVFSGKKLKVVWDYKKAPSYIFTGSGFYYKVVISKMPSWKDRMH